ncbi:MAG: ATP-dependent DNA helicase RecG [Deltaproteobacteria bacterium]|nr:ATP-dependent DNA helicase RecG [Deltaproteobacteria bacterium]
MAQSPAPTRDLGTPFQYVKGVGPRLAQIFLQRGVVTVEDALYTLPRRYEDRRHFTRIAQAQIGTHQSLLGEVLLLGTRPIAGGRRHLFELVVGDGSGTLSCKWFQFHPRTMMARFRRGQRLILYGEVRAYGGSREMIHPEVELAEEEGEGSEPLHFRRIVPVYTLPEGLYQRQLRRIMKHAVDEYAAGALEGLPAAVRTQHVLPDLADSLRDVHFPPEDADVEALNREGSPAHRRLIFDEFFFLELGLALRRQGVQEEPGIAFRPTGRLTDRLLGGLPFALTNAQARVLEEIRRDMEAPRPMNRLLQGDVGSGKTLVAVLASLMAVESGYQAALMAPTEILAEQHYRTVHQLVAPLGVRVALLTSALTPAQRERLHRHVAQGLYEIVVGTHALIQEPLAFARLGLAVIDEQHRFGVLQRAALRAKGAHPDILVMTATPIPRTLALTVYGDLDLAVIDGMPPGRQPIRTRVVPAEHRALIERLVAGEVQAGRQAYVVYPLVEESEKAAELRDATRMAEELQQRLAAHETLRSLPRPCRVGLVHGRLSGEEKDRVMAEFREGRVDVLVATTVIEVGIDVANATLMVVEHAERFGLSQLHQLRGRVGRGSHPSQCVLVAPRAQSEEVRRRLQAMARTADGFQIAEEDLALRGPGEFLGTRQSGLPDFRVGNLLRDGSLLAQAREAAFALVREDPRLRGEPATRMVLRRRWQGRLELVGIG